MLPSSVCPPTTEAVGLFEIPVRALADWLRERLGLGWKMHATTATSLKEAIELVSARTEMPRELRHLLLPLDGWTVLLNDSTHGTDVGLIPMHAARVLGCRAIRAVAAPGGEGRYRATILEVYSPNASEREDRLQRFVFAVDDGGKWRFGESGDPFPFEVVQRYSKPRVRDRFTPSMLVGYLQALGVPNAAPDFHGAMLIEKSD